MSSVRFDGGKCHGAGEAKAIMRHCDAEQRKEHNHSNADIDTSKTDMNYSMEGLSYEEKCRKYDKRVAECEANMAKLRKDRVTMVSVNVKTPEKLPPEKEDEWFRKVYDLISEQYGKENMIDGDVHKDEQHEYYDPDKKEMVMSRNELHAYFVPEVDGVLNAKQAMSRANINKINNAVQRMTMQDYGVEFMDGSKKKGLDTEQAKARSQKALIEQQQATIEQQRAELNRLADRLGAEKLKFDEIDALNQKARENASESEKLLKTAHSVSERTEEIPVPVQRYFQEVPEAKNQYQEWVTQKKREAEARKEAERKRGAEQVKQVMGEAQRVDDAKRELGYNAMDFM